MNLLNITVFFALLFGLPVMGKAQPTHEQLVGTWHASQYVGADETNKWLLKLMADQTYVTVSISCMGRNLSWLQKEMGAWKLEQDQLVTMPESRESFNGVRDVEADTTIIFTDIALNNHVLSFKDINQTLFEFKPVDAHVRMRCRSLNTVN